ncbi:MAG: SBBP repeat-containing protein [Candidatus Odinarchaeota archaeon]
MKLNGKLLLITFFFLLLSSVASTQGKHVISASEMAVKTVTGSNGLVYSSLFGGSGDDYGCAISRDSQNNTIIAGITYSGDFPVTEGAYITPHRGGSDVFVSKIAENSTLLFSTIIGGSNSETELSPLDGNDLHILEIALDSADNIIIQGTTHSSDFPTTEGAYDTTYDGNKDIFIAKLSADGSDLLFGTYLGGSAADVLTRVTDRTIALDDADNIYVTGLTASSDFPVTSDALQSVHAAHGTDADAFITKLSADGAEILYSTFLGGSFNEGGTSLALDGEGNVIIGGYTASADFPTTANAYDTTHSGYEDGFIAKLSANGSTLAFSTFLGGTNGDWVTTITVDEKGDIYIAGETTSSNYPVTGGASDTSHSGLHDSFVTKLSSDGTELQFSTFLGGSGDDAPLGVVLDKEKSVYVIGITSSSDFQIISTVNNIASSALKGELDYTITKISPDGSFLQYSSYLGGDANEIMNLFPRLGSPAGIDLVNEDNVIVVGTTNSADFPVTADAFNKTLAYSDATGGRDVFITQLTWSPLTEATTTTTSNGVPGFDILAGVSSILAAGTLVNWSRRRKRNR